MTIQGLNITANIIRETEGDDDAVGGATVTESIVYRNVKVRISNVKPTVEMRAAGMETTSLFNAHAVPAPLDIRETDKLIPQNGPHKDNEFLITGVQKSSLLDSDPRSFLGLRLQRVRRARTDQ